MIVCYVVLLRFSVIVCYVPSRRVLPWQCHPLWRPGSCTSERHTRACFCRWVVAGISGQHDRRLQWRRARLGAWIEMEACWWYKTTVPSACRSQPPPKSCGRMSTCFFLRRSSAEKLVIQGRLVGRLGLESGCNSWLSVPSSKNCIGWSACAGAVGYRRWQLRCAIDACRLWNGRRSTWWRLSQGGSFGDQRSESHRSRTQCQR